MLLSVLHSPYIKSLEGGVFFLASPKRSIFIFILHCGFTDCIKKSSVHDSIIHCVVFPHCAETGRWRYSVRVSCVLRSIRFEFTLQQPQPKSLSDIPLCSPNTSVSPHHKSLFSCDVKRETILLENIVKRMSNLWPSCFSSMQAK